MPDNNEENTAVMNFSIHPLCGAPAVLTVRAQSAREAAGMVKRVMCAGQDAGAPAGDAAASEGLAAIAERRFDLLGFERGLTIRCGGDEFDASGMKRPCAENASAGAYDHPKRAGGLVFLWGVRSHFDTEGTGASLYTANDIEVLYDTGSKKYTANIEEIYYFGSAADRTAYLESLCGAFREFALSAGCTEEELDDISGCSVYESRYPTLVFGEVMPLEAYTLADLWQKFRIFVWAYEKIGALGGRPGTVPEVP